MTTETASKLRAIPALTGSGPTLDLSRLPANPVTLFYEWLDTALSANMPEPLAMTLATVDAQGMPDARTRIVKDVDDRGWAFAGPRSGSTGVQLAARPVGAMNFWWQPLVRAIRVRGPVVEASRRDSEADLAARSAAARADVEPDGWGLWRLQPERVEFWQGSPDRRHIRVVYKLNAGEWALGVQPEV